MSKVKTDWLFFVTHASGVYSIDDLPVARRARGELAGDIALLAALLAIALSPIPFVRTSAFLGSLDLYASIEMIGALVGLLTGFALCVRFYSLGNRYHLFLGLAFFVSGIKDLMHGLVCFSGSAGFLRMIGSDWTFETRFLEEFIPVTYVAGQLLLCLMLLLALTLPGWMKQSSNRERETSRVSLIVLVITLGVSLALDYSSTPGRQQQALRPILIASLVASLFGMCAYAWRYLRDQDLLSWWIASAIGINGIGQLMFLLSTRLFDGLFELAHLYKVIGYILPLVGFLLYQIAVVLEYQRSQQELIRTREAALAATRAKSEFLANISHEIRTPMNAIVGMTNRVLKTDLTAEQQRFLETLRESTDSLLQLLNDLLDFSKFEAGKFNLRIQAFSPRECLLEAIRSIALVAQEKGLETKLAIADDVPDSLFGDGIRLRQILVNLLNNAVKFTDSGSIQVAVKCNFHDSERVELHFSVADTGIGVPVELQQEIFQAFTQADGSTTRLYGGTGLGLAICSQLVELMNGRIWIESEPGFGSRFHFLASFDRIGPAEQISSQNKPAPMDPPRSLRTTNPKRILVAEDNAVNRELLAATLRDMGHEVQFATDGRQAVSLALEQPFDVVLMDLQMPRMSGLQATAEIRDRLSSRIDRLPIYAMTAHAMQSDRQQCVEAGMDGFVTKPVSETTLFDLLENVGAASAHHAVSDSPLPPETGESTVPAGSLVDLGRLQAHLKNDFELLDELISLFREQVAPLVSQMKEGAKAGDFRAVGAAAHTLAGSVGNFHAPLVRQAAIDIEKMARQLDPGDLRGPIGLLEKSLGELLRELDEISLSACRDAVK